MIHESTSDLQIRAKTGIKESLGFESVIRELIDLKIFEIIWTGLQRSFRIFKQMLQFEFILFNWF